MWWFIALFVALIALATAAAYSALRPKPRVPEVKKDAFFITGAGGGLGLQVVRALDKAGYVVFAGVFLDSEEKAILSSCSDRVHVVRIDITKRDSVVRAKEEVKALIAKLDCRLYGLLNNAGIAIGAPLMCITPDMLQEQFAVNYFGHVHVTQEFLSLLMQTAVSTGAARIVSTISVAGRICSHNLGAYAGSKHAMEAFTDALRQELGKFGIVVVGIEPAFIKTPMVTDHKASAARTWARCINRELYPDYAGNTAENMTMVNGRMSLEPEAIVAPMMDALVGPCPKTRYTLAKGFNPIWFHFLPIPSVVLDGLSELAGVIPRTSRQDAKGHASNWLAALSKEKTR